MMNERRLEFSNSSFIIPHSSLLLCFPVNLQGHAGRVPPVERARPFESARTEFGAQGVVVNQSCEGACERARVERVCRESGVADDLRQACQIPRQDGRAAAHRFERGKPESLEVGGVGETECPRIQCWQVAFGYIAGENYRAADSLLLNRLQRLAVEPGPLAHENQLRQITPPALAAQERIGAHQTLKVLPRLDR